jgi:hypothetical protein
VKVMGEFEESSEVESVPEDEVLTDNKDKDKECK